MVEKYTKLKTATAAIIRRREDIDARLQKANERAGRRREAQLAAALDTNQDDLAVVLIQKKNAARRRSSPSCAPTWTSRRRTPTRPSPR